MNEPRNILAILPNWLGDAAMCTPALRALHNRFPDAQITIAGRTGPIRLLSGLPWPCRAVRLPARPTIPKLISAAWRLRPHSGDLAIVFPHSFRSALLARFTGARRRVGHARDGRSWLLTETVEPERKDGRITPVYMAREYLELVRTVGCQDDGKGLQLVADPNAVAAVKQKLEPGRPHVGIAPGAAFGPSKLWPAERYAHVADALARDLDAQCVVLTGPGEEPTRDAVMRAAKSSLITLDDQYDGIETLKAAVSQLQLLIGNDSGARHVAVAFGVPTVCIMGPTSPAYSDGPYESGTLIRVEVDCGPCQKPACHTDHRCMTQISAETVTAAALELLAPADTRGALEN